MIDKLLAYAALFLGLINGVFLLRQYLRDRPKLIVSAVHPSVYQWWIKLPSGEYDGHKTRRFGFMPYFEVSNRGLRKVSISTWKLNFRTKGLRKIKLEPLNIVEPVWEGEKITKAIPVMGQKSNLFSGSTIVESGCSISGFSYYIFECYGDDTWNPRMKNNRIVANIEITDVFGKVSRTKISFNLKDVTFVEKYIPGIEDMHRDKKVIIDELTT